MVPALYLEHITEEGSGASTVPGVEQRGRELQQHSTLSISGGKGVVPALYLEYSREKASGGSTVPRV